MYMYVSMYIFISLRLHERSVTPWHPPLPPPQSSLPTPLTSGEIFAIFNSLQLSLSARCMLIKSLCNSSLSTSVNDNAAALSSNKLFLLISNPHLMQYFSKIFKL